MQIRWGSFRRGRQTTEGLSTTTVFGYFGGYLFGNCGDKDSIIIIIIKQSIAGL